MNQPVLEISDLQIGYSGRKILNATPYSLKFPPGELFCLMGANGSGKSTLLKTLAGIHNPINGSILLEGRTIKTYTASTLARKLSIVLTEQPQSNHMKVKELIAIGRYPYTGWLGTLTADDMQKTEAAAAFAGITHLWNQSIAELSDGERQKVMIGRALAQDTPLILLDEPTAHLDLPNRVSVMQLLRNLVKRTGKSVLLTTHDLELALQSADKAGLIMPDGSLIAGIPEDLVLQGAFENAFEEKGFRFDKATGNFKIQPSLRGYANVKGNGLLASWTQRALERKGYQVVEEPQSLCVHVIPDKNELILKIKAQSYTCHTIEALLDKIKTLQ